MNAEQYRAVINWFQARPAAKNALRLVSRGECGAGLPWVSGAAGVAGLAPDGSILARTGCACGGVCGGHAGAAHHRPPAPLTALGFTPLFPKDKPGQSMPSRHCFSAAAIAGAAWFVIRPLGLALAVLAVVIAVCRVVTGVHYISDVLAGLAFGAVFAVVGWNAFVLAASAVGFTQLCFYKRKYV